MIRSRLPPEGQSPTAPVATSPGLAGGPCSPPGSPPAEASCKSHQPGRMDPSGEATGNVLQLRNYHCKRSPRSQRTLEKGAESRHPWAEAEKHDQLGAEKEILQVTQTEN